MPNVVIATVYYIPYRSSSFLFQVQQRFIGGVWTLKSPRNVAVSFSLCLRNVPGIFICLVPVWVGKTVSDSTFLTGSLQRPSRFLLTAISILRSDPDIPAEPLTQYIDRIVAQNPGYKRPGREHDILPKFEHEHKPTRDTCEQCNSRRKVRSTNHPEIHYGLIASGNQVMRDAKIRDNLGKKYKDKVLCFEMEAAGVMNTIPCLVIRGICDYADSHKNDVWQEYASATAAAYARLLLCYARK
ncbi:Nucleoside phosphorylase domain containing protein [Elaphomyces granulatus]